MSKFIILNHDHVSKAGATGSIFRPIKKTVWQVWGSKIEKQARVR